jgi:hypothetical protein
VKVDKILEIYFGKARITSVTIFQEKPVEFIYIKMRIESNTTYIIIRNELKTNPGFYYCTVKKGEPYTSSMNTSSTIQAENSTANSTNKTAKIDFRDFLKYEGIKQHKTSIDNLTTLCRFDFLDKDYNYEWYIVGTSLNPNPLKAKYTTEVIYGTEATTDKDKIIITLGSNILSF